MKRIIFFLFMVLPMVFISLVSLAQYRPPPVNPVRTDTWTINFGAGPGINYYPNWKGGYGFGPGAQIAFETGLWDIGPGVITLGGEFGFSVFWDKWADNDTIPPDLSYQYTWINLSFGARSAYHYGWDIPGLDTYGGIMIGCRVLAFSDAYTNQSENAVNPGLVLPIGGIFVGGSYWFNPQIGINAEAGYNITYAQVGMVFKIQ